MLACFALYIAHMYAGTTEALVEALPSAPAARTQAEGVVLLAPQLATLAVWNAGLPALAAPRIPELRLSRSDPSGSMWG